MIKNFSKNVLWYGGSQIVRSITPFLMLPILTHYLNTYDYGILSLVEVFILFLFPVVSINIHSAINVQYFKLENSASNFRYYVTNAIVLSIASYIVIEGLFILFSHKIRTLFHVNTVLVCLLPLMALLRLYPQIMLSLYQAQTKARSYFLFTFSQSLTDFILSILLVVILLQGYIGRLEGTYMTFFIFSLITFYFLNKKKLIGKITFKYSKQILNYGVFLIPHAISGVIMAMSDRFFISYFYNNSYVGIYTVAYQTSALLLLIGTSVNKAWSPFLYRMLKTKNKRSEIFKYIAIIYLLFILIAIFILLFKNIIFNLLISEKFFKAKEYFNYLLFGFLFQILYMIITNFMFFYEKTKFLSSLTVSGAILNIVLNYILIHKFGVKGVAIATMVTWLFYFLIVLSKVINYKKWEIHETEKY